MGSRKEEVHVLGCWTVHRRSIQLELRTGGRDRKIRLNESKGRVPMDPLKIRTRFSLYRNILKINYFIEYEKILSHRVEYHLIDLSIL